MAQLTAIADTWIKRQPVQSAELSPVDLIRVEVGKKIAVLDRNISISGNGHHRVVFQPPLNASLNGRPSQWVEGFIFAKDWSGLPAQTVAAAPMSASGEVRLNVPYKSQTDNVLNPSGSCNVTSCAMVLEYYSIKGSGNGQLEDELYQWLQANNLSRHEPSGLKAAIEQYGCKDEFRSDATIEQMRSALSQGIPLIVHGYFTRSGHIVVLTGHNADGFIVNDPWGQLIDGRYIINSSIDPRKGEGVIYGYDMIRQTCLPDGGCWTHFVTGPQRVLITPASPTLASYKAICNTYIKARPVQAIELSEDEKRFARSGDMVSGVFQGTDSGHLHLTIDGKDAYLFSEHFRPSEDTPSSSPRKHAPQTFRLNSIATAMIKSYEGLDLDAYLDSEGIPTIGIGTTVYPGGKPVKLGDRITSEQAIAFFSHDVDRFIASLRQLVDVSLTGRQIAALTSFIYNCGEGAFADSTLLKRINSSAPAAEVQAQFRRWTNNGLAGLVKRRESECALWVGDDWEKHR